ncbi:MAG: CbiX/SirB N-terminal domain-containing protein [Verrucomicrobiae bacterium]|nr:CbiX/SirB N-terminal domain-containing protein [Verrucomicrobiae bacterium]
MPSLADAALLILGHGSTQNAESALPTHLHALEICRRRIFKEVHVAFWKEEPNFRAALRPIQAPIVFIVPNFISEGYFTQEIIPRELSLTPPITRTPHHTLAYCTPVGLHPSMTQALLQRANEIVSPPPPPLRQPYSS